MRRTSAPEEGTSRTGRWRRLPQWSRARWLITGLCLALVAAAGVGWSLLRKDDQEGARSITTTASVGEVTRTVSATGTLEPAKSESLSFEVSGTVTAVLVDLGDTVRKGQALARVDKTLLQSQLDAAVSTVTAAEQDLDDAESGDSSVRLAAAQSQLVTARDDVREAREAVGNAVMRAPFAGQVVSLDLEAGDVVGSSGGSGGSGGASDATATTPTSTASSDSSAAIEVASVKQFVVDTTVSSTDLTSVRKGLQAEITATGVENTLYGTVTSVGRVATTTSAGGAAFPVTVTLTGDVEEVYGGTSASVEIIVEKRSDVLTVPTRAVRSGDDGATYVNVVEGGSTTRQEIEIGETYGESTEVLEGLTEGDSIEVVALPSGGRGGGQMPGGGQLPGDGQLPGGGQFPGGGSMPGGFPGAGQ